MTPIIEMRGIQKQFGAVHALRNVNFHLMPGEILGLVGDNSAGKSTLMKTMTGAYQRDGGDVHVPAQREVLVDHLDPDVAALLRPAEMRRLAVDEHLAVVALVGAGQHLHERRLAGGVVADETEDLAGLQAEIHVSQRVHGAEILLDAAHLDDGGGVMPVSFGGLRQARRP